MFNSQANEFHWWPIKRRPYLWNLVLIPHERTDIGENNDLFGRGLVGQYEDINNLNLLLLTTKPLPNRWSLFSYMVSVRPSIRHKNENKIRGTKDTMRENNDHLSAVAWWVTLKSPDLLTF